jgi:hypothetical protein
MTTRKKKTDHQIVLAIQRLMNLAIRANAQHEAAEDIAFLLRENGYKIDDAD